MASHRSRSDPLLSLSPRLGILIAIVCRLSSTLMNLTRLIFSITGEMAVSRGRCSHVTGPVWCYGSFHHCKRSDTDLSSQ